MSNTRIKKEPPFDVKSIFLALTSHTYPYGNEHRLKHFLPNNITRDRHGNYIYQIGSSRTIFACHLDTASKDYSPVTHVFDGDYIKTDGKTILGADDKAGVTVLLYLINKRIPGTYYFFVGEEVGCIGSKAASKDGNFENYDRIVSFDRRNVCSIITYQQGSRCCSNTFATALSEKFNEHGLDLKPDDTGLVTDSAQFTSVIPECTNISVGYYSEHQHCERQDIVFLEKLCIASAKINWEALPTERNHKVVERKYNNYTNYNTQPYTGRHNKNAGWDKNTWRENSRGNNYSSHSYNTHEHHLPFPSENLIDEAFEFDRKKRERERIKREKKENKENKKKKYDRFEDIDDMILNNILEQRRKERRDTYLPFKELLNEQSFFQERNDPPLFSEKEYKILEENLH